MMLGQSLAITQPTFGGGGAPAPPPALTADASAFGTVTSQSSITVAHTVGVTSGYGLLKIDIAFTDPLAGTPSVTGVTYNGIPCTLIAGSLRATPVLGTIVSYYLLNPPSGNHNVVVTFDTTVHAAVGSTSYDGVNQSAPFGTPVLGSGTGTNATVALTVAAGNYATAALAIYAGTATTGATAQGNLTNLTSPIAGVSPDRTRCVSAYNPIDSGSLNPAWTLAASKPWAMSGVELKAA